MDITSNATHKGHGNFKHTVYLVGANRVRPPFGVEMANMVAFPAGRMPYAPTGVFDISESLRLDFMGGAAQAAELEAQRITKPTWFR